MAAKIPFLSASGSLICADRRSSFLTVVGAQTAHAFGVDPLGIVGFEDATPDQDQLAYDVWVARRHDEGEHGAPGGADQRHRSIGVRRNGVAQFEHLSFERIGRLQRLDHAPFQRQLTRHRRHGSRRAGTTVHQHDDVGRFAVSSRILHLHAPSIGSSIADLHCHRDVRNELRLAGSGSNSRLRMFEETGHSRSVPYAGRPSILAGTGRQFSA